MIFEKVKRFFRRLKRFLIPPRLVRVYIYEFTAYGVVKPFTKTTRDLMRRVYKENTLIHWECVFDEFVTLVPTSEEVERRYYDDVEKDLVPYLNTLVISGRRLTYRDLVDGRVLLKMPLARYFKEWVKRQIEMGRIMVPWQGVCKLELKGVSATLKEIVEVEEREFRERMRILQGKVIDDFRFGLIRPDETEPFDIIYDRWTHDIA